jgi:hypothetical protein
LANNGVAVSADNGQPEPRGLGVLQDRNLGICDMQVFCVDVVRLAEDVVYLSTRYQSGNLEDVILHFKNSSLVASGILKTYDDELHYHVLHLLFEVQRTCGVRDVLAHVVSRGKRQWEESGILPISIKRIVTSTPVIGWASSLAV